MLTQDRLKELLDYDPETGSFKWRVSSGRSKAGVEAGSKGTRYVQIRIDGHRCYAHRLAWLCIYGEWPEDQIDHIDCNPLNNRIANLRSATPSQNNANAYARERNKCGLKGVSFAKDDRTGRPWRAYIGVERKNKHLGCFATPELAHAAYIAAANSLFGEFARAA